MPTVLRVGPYRFFFYAGDRNEPQHIHVERDDKIGIERYETLARKIAEDTFIKYSFTPSLFEGLTGIGEFMLDMFHFTGDQAYRHKALDIADTVLWFKIDKPEGVAYPGRW